MMTDDDDEEQDDDNDYDDDDNDGLRRLRIFDLVGSKHNPFVADPGTLVITMTQS